MQALILSGFHARGDARTWCRVDLVVDARRLKRLCPKTPRVCLICAPLALPDLDVVQPDLMCMVGNMACEDRGFILYT